MSSRKAFFLGHSFSACCLPLSAFDSRHKPFFLLFQAFRRTCLRNQSQRLGFGYRQFIWKVTSGSSSQGMGRVGRKGRTTNMCVLLSWLSQWLMGPNPTEAPLRSCVEYAPPLLSTAPSTHWLKGASEMFTPMYFQAVPAHELRVFAEAGT